MEVKKIKVSKGNVIKEIEAHQQIDYVNNGWTVVKENTFINNIKLK